MCRYLVSNTGLVSGSIKHNCILFGTGKLVGPAGFWNSLAEPAGVWECLAGPAGERY